MASKGGGCVNGTLVTESYTSPLPLVGLYIAVATAVCFFCMTYDLVHGFFKRKRKPYFPSRWFRMNAFTLTVLAVATKIPNDLVTAMPRLEDQLSKLTATALLCTAIAFYMPSMGAVKTSERYGNLAALSVIVITMVVNVCIQIHTGVIFVFTTEHIIIVVCLAVLLLFMWSSAIALRGQLENNRLKSRYSERSYPNYQAEDLLALANRLYTADTLASDFSHQTLLCRTPNHHTFGLLCAISLVVVLQSMVRYWFAPGSIGTCITADTVSDYKWSIRVVIWSQFLTIVVGSSCIIYRWYSLLCRLKENLLEVGRPQFELENLRLKTLPPQIRFLNKKLCNVPVVAKDFFIDYVLIPIQFRLYKCNIFLVGKPIHYVFHRFHEHWETTQLDMYNKEVKGYRDSCKRDCPTDLLDLISKYCSPGRTSLEYAPSMGELEASGRSYFAMVEGTAIYEYRVSCVSVLVLSGILTELMPPSSPRGESVMQILKWLFEIIYFVDQRTHSPIWDNERRWMATQEVWAHWENPTHWFRTEIISKFNLKQVQDLEVLKDTLAAIETHFRRHTYRFVMTGILDSSLTKKHMALVSIEFAIICKFIGKQNCGSVENLFDFLEECLVKMLCFTLSSFPLAILNELDVEDPYEIGEGGTRKALKYYHKLEHLFGRIEWTWQAKSGHSAAGAAAAGTDDNDGIVVVVDDNDGIVVGGNGTISTIGSKMRKSE